MKQRTVNIIVFVATLILGFIVGFALTARASHVNDGGVDQLWVNEMNQESYWEAIYGGDCTKFDNHSGSIPAGVEVAVIKDGNMVRVYEKPGPYVALGAVNPANGQHFAAPHSWVMKCDVPPPTTTTTVVETTTTEGETTSTSTTLVDTTTTTSETTTTSTPDSSSTTTIARPSTTPVPTSVVTTTAPADSTAPSPDPTLTVPVGPTVTVPADPSSPAGVETLPFTGVPVMGLVLTGLTLVGGGVALLRRKGIK